MLVPPGMEQFKWMKVHKTAVSEKSYNSYLELGRGRFKLLDTLYKSR